MDVTPFSKEHILVVSSEPHVLAEIKMGLIEHFDVSITANTADLSVMETYRAVIIYIGKNQTKALSIYESTTSFLKSRGVPVIFLSETDDESAEAAAFAFGASDFAVKRSGSATALIYRLKSCINSREKEHKGGEAPAGADVSPEEVLSGKSVLIAEDVQLNRDIISELFSDIEGFNIDFAFDGRDAVSKFENNSDVYSIIFMDIQMPEMDGLEATRLIRRLNREIPIIALTATVNEEEVKRFLNAGMNDFIEKPIDYVDFLNKAAKYALQQ